MTVKTFIEILEETKAYVSIPYRYGTAIVNAFEAKTSYDEKRKAKAVELCQFLIGTVQPLSKQN